MWFVHHLSADSRHAIGPKIVLPLLPTEQHGPEGSRTRTAAFALLTLSLRLRLAECCTFEFRPQRHPARPLRRRRSSASTRTPPRARRATTSPPRPPSSRERTFAYCSARPRRAPSARRCDADVRVSRSSRGGSRLRTVGATADRCGDARRRRRTTPRDWRFDWAAGSGDRDG